MFTPVEPAISVENALAQILSELPKLISNNSSIGDIREKIIPLIRKELEEQS